jgi:hypothetical protein
MVNLELSHALRGPSSVRADPGGLTHGGSLLAVGAFRPACSPSNVSAIRSTIRANRESPVFEELYHLVLKTIGLREPLTRSPAMRTGIKIAFVYGSVAKGSDGAKSDIDMMVIGEELDYSDLYVGLQKAEALLRR